MNTFYIPDDIVLVIDGDERWPGLVKSGDQIPEEVVRMRPQRVVPEYLIQYFPLDGEEEYDWLTADQMIPYAPNLAVAQSTAVTAALVYYQKRNGRWRIYDDVIGNGIPIGVQLPQDTSFIVRTPIGELDHFPSAISGQISACEQIKQVEYAGAVLQDGTCITLGSFVKAPAPTVSDGCQCMRVDTIFQSSGNIMLSGPSIIKGPQVNSVFPMVVSLQTVRSCDPFFDDSLPPPPHLDEKPAAEQSSEPEDASLLNPLPDGFQLSDMQCDVFVPELFLSFLQGKKEAEPVCAFCHQAENAKCGRLIGPIFSSPHLLGQCFPGVSLENGLTYDPNSLGEIATKKLRTQKPCYFHHNCAYFTPEVWHADTRDVAKVQSSGDQPVYSDPSDGSAWFNVAKAIRRSRGLRCFTCRQSGASIGCWVASCRYTAHYLCSSRTNWRFPDSRAFYCPKHRTSQKH